MDVLGAVETPHATGAFGEALLADLAQVLPAIGLSPVAVALVQHDPRTDGVQPAVLAVLGDGSARTQLLDVGRIGMATVFNDVLPVVRPSAPGAVPVPQPPAARAAAAPAPTTSAPEPVAAPEPPLTPVVEPEPVGDPGTDRIWAAFEDAVRPQLGRGAAKAVKASQKAAAGMDDAQLLEFLAERLTNFGPHTVESFRSALQG